MFGVEGIIFSKAIFFFIVAIGLSKTTDYYYKWCGHALAISNFCLFFIIMWGCYCLGLVMR